MKEVAFPWLLNAGFQLGLFYDPEDGRRMTLVFYMVLCARRENASAKHGKGKSP
jgi:hypothetical protein